MPKPKVASGAAWAREQKRNVRTCETCAIGGELIAFVAAAWREIREGRSAASRQQLHREIVKRYRYPFTFSALRNHTNVCVK